jgi:glycosyltransferase involved in cell wall biosynthesis
MIESLACGTPVIAWRRGSVPEIIDDGVTGFIVDSVEAAVRAVGRLGEIDRLACRRAFDTRFDANRMARDYVNVYEQVIERTPRP